MADESMTGSYRVGRHQPRNVYRGDVYVGVMFTDEDAALVVEALNRETWTPEELDAATARARVDAAEFQAFVDDSCTCTKAGPDPACVVHQGRRARGPKPPPLGPGCICDGSGRTCPRHGAVS